MLESYIAKRREENEILLMTHMVLGYPSFEDNWSVLEAMNQAGVELVELQIPFSEPTADGPVILKANGYSLSAGTKVESCFQFAEKACNTFPRMKFLFMTYLNIPYQYGLKAFVERAGKIGIAGTILPDLPVEEAKEWMDFSEKAGVDPVLIFTPTNTKERLKTLGVSAKGLVYCVGRRGVTGEKTDFDATLEEQIQTYKEATTLPLALGFGVKSKEDVQFLRGKVEVAVIGSEVIRIQETSGNQAVETFLKNLRV